MFEWDETKWLRNIGDGVAQAGRGDAPHIRPVGMFLLEIFLARPGGRTVYASLTVSFRHLTPVYQNPINWGKIAS